MRQIISIKLKSLFVKHWIGAFLASKIVNGESMWGSPIRTMFAPGHVVGGSVFTSNMPVQFDTTYKISVSNVFVENAFNIFHDRSAQCVSIQIKIFNRLIRKLSYWILLISSKQNVLSFHFHIYFGRV